jgi:hypothetical protein
MTVMLVMSTLTYLMVMKSWISIIALKTVITEMCRCGLVDCEAHDVHDIRS